MVDDEHLPRAVVEYVSQAIQVERHTRQGTEGQLLASITRLDDRMTRHESWHQELLESQIAESVRAKQYLIANIIAILAMVGTVLGVVLHG